ncbi:L,D-transpeptidase [Mesorhizobium sp. BAC0120]|uniref:L,D-transpeptidase n=1 Tax=Mesorhizobium sp. BAC0120 TaxID=3090670 RepID=UPI00298D027E|nr:L,D-transpeptidase [Mesorhizobium sp. BAC0120]MDW6022286.1 L,D-transpeptidase [Mesorhizobium sp. BAC0120]
MTIQLSRRSFLIGTALAGASAVSACTTMPAPSTQANAAPPPRPAPPLEPQPTEVDHAAVYAGMEDQGYALPAIPFQKVDRRFLRQLVVDPTGEAPGSIVVDTTEKHLYWVLKDGMAMRYGVGLGRQGYSWKGRAVVQWKRKWPTWTPPDAMIKRDPRLEKWRQGMPPGLDNPLGSRALYIFQNGEDTLYRIHGSPDWQSIGKAASSGCVRMFNQDVIHLYDHVPSKTPLLVT